MKSKKRLEEFYVPSGFIKEFAKLIQKYKLNNVIAGVEDDDVVVFIDYLNNEQRVINRIHNKINEYVLPKNRKDLGKASDSFSGSEVFQVPERFIAKFAGLVTKYGLKNSIVGRWPSDLNDGWLISVFVYYEENEQWIIDEINKKIQKYHDDQNNRDEKWRLNGV
jgi:hypothetical protein